MSSDKTVLESIICEAFEPDSSSISNKNNVQLIVEKKEELPPENATTEKDKQNEQAKK